MFFLNDSYPSPCVHHLFYQRFVDISKLPSLSTLNILACLRGANPKVIYCVFKALMPSKYGLFRCVFRRSVRFGLLAFPVGSALRDCVAEAIDFGN